LEDVVTTGKSLKETMEVVEANGGLVVATGALVDRNPGDLLLDVPFSAIARLEFPTYDPASCVLCQSGSQPVKPGSRPASKDGASS
jgi:orotate phosphoribosyltransferase